MEVNWLLSEIPCVQESSLNCVFQGENGHLDAFLWSFGSFCVWGDCVVVKFVWPSMVVHTRNPSIMEMKDFEFEASLSTTEKDRVLKKKEKKIVA